MLRYPGGRGRCALACGPRSRALNPQHDIEHYRKRPDYAWLWCVVYDGEGQITNAEGLRDLEGVRKNGRW
jgi:hypothetical protein